MKWFSPRGPRRSLAVYAPLCLAATVLTACAGTEKPAVIDSGGAGGPAASAQTSMSAAEIRAKAGALVDGAEASMSGYSREKFPHWDTNKPEHGFGTEYAQYAKCTSREVMMLRDATGPVTLDPKTCDLKVGAGGGWQDAYGFLDSKTGQLKPYKFITDPADVDAEHIVALAEAWRSGANKLDEDTRRRIANDALNLEASDPSANRSKGDQDAANYLPPGSFRCVYLERYVTVKVKYGLTVDPAERTAILAAIDDCAGRGEFR
ncbi:HNH endonuclease family protein [Nocardia takedensis]|uniref:HNH endonuclease family protein n=1 Tax=Nocardia takedensis TaxID=259390 RepID=UPI000594D31F|nr:HNH endonuclease family protein [Nocardia takedensis]